jgi:hypothetical protein
MAWRGQAAVQLTSAVRGGLGLEAGGSMAAGFVVSVPPDPPAALGPDADRRLIDARLQRARREGMICRATACRSVGP